MTVATTNMPITSIKRPACTIGVSVIAICGWHSPAVAHVGHIGELAGHGHLVGIALTGAAIALAGWVIKDSVSSKSSDEAADDSNQGLQGEGSHSETGDEVHA